MNKKEFYETIDQHRVVLKKWAETGDFDESTRESFRVTFDGVLQNRIYLHSNYCEINDLARADAPVVGKRVLDYGSGCGYVTLLLRKAGYSGINAIDCDGTNSIDSEEEGVYLNVTSLAEYLDSNYSDLDFRIYKGPELPYEDAYFDTVVANAVIEHIAENEVIASVRELARVLKSGGMLFVTKLPRRWSVQEWAARVLGMKAHKKLYTKAEIIALLENCGFQVKKVKNTDLMFNNYIFTTLSKILTPFVIAVETIFNFWPFNVFAHNYQLIAVKEGGREQGAGNR